LKKRQYGVFNATLIFGPYLFEEIIAYGIHTCSVLGKRYHNMLRNFVIPQLEERGDLQDIIFMQDGEPLHIDRRVHQC